MTNIKNQEEYLKCNNKINTKIVFIIIKPKLRLQSRSGRPNVSLKIGSTHCHEKLQMGRFLFVFLKRF